MITIVDYGLGNVGSVANMFAKIGARAKIVNDAKALGAAEALVLPGVGHFDAGMRLLREGGFVDALGELVVAKKTPILGICLGMQLFSRRSEEGGGEGLGWLAADTKRIVAPPGVRLVIPHMGWSPTQGTDPALFGEFHEVPRFYYVHSFHVVCDDPRDVAATCHYGVDLCAAVHKGNVYGTQFHPEKSHRFGMTLLRSFVAAVRSR